MFVTLDKIGQADPKYADILLLENYAAFQNRYPKAKCKIHSCMNCRSTAFVDW